MSNASDFVIENGVLIKYVGPGGDVVIPDGVTEIGKKAFCMTESVNNFGIVYETVKDNTTLTGVSLPEGLVRIGAYAFERCVTLAGVTLPQSVKSIDQYAFVHCKALETVICKEGSLREIGESAFYDCEKLQTFDIRFEDTGEIGAGAFRECKSLADEDGFVIVHSVLFDYFGKGGDIVVPEGVTALGDNCFARCNVYQRGHVDMETIHLPDTLRTIGGFALECCELLTEITIPEEVKEIGDYAFRKCKRLNRVILPKKLLRLGKYAFCQCSIETLELPPSLIDIGEGALMNNKMQELYLPDHIESISDRAFIGQMYAFFTLYVKKGSVTEKAIKKYSKKNKYKIVTAE